MERAIRGNLRYFLQLLIGYMLRYDFKTVFAFFDYIVMCDITSFSFLQKLMPKRIHRNMRTKRKKIDSFFGFDLIFIIIDSWAKIKACSMWIVKPEEIFLFIAFMMRSFIKCKHHCYCNISCPCQDNIRQKKIWNM